MSDQTLETVGKLLQQNQKVRSKTHKDYSTSINNSGGDSPEREN